MPGLNIKSAHHHCGRNELIPAQTWTCSHSSIPGLRKKSICTIFPSRTRTFWCLFFGYAIYYNKLFSITLYCVLLIYNHFITVVYYVNSTSNCCATMYTFCHKSYFVGSFLHNFALSNLKFVSPASRKFNVYLCIKKLIKKWFD